VSNVHIGCPFGEPRFGHAWRGEDGRLHAAVYLGASWVELSDPAAARALAAEAIRAAEAMEELPPATTPPGVTHR
jgi:hypothetical protein